MGYRGKVAEQERARELRAAGWTYNEICVELGVSKSSVSGWCRDTEIDELAWAARVRTNRNHGARHRRPHRQALEKQAEIARLLAEGRERVGRLSEREYLFVGAALYAGEGGKTGGAVSMANCDPRILLFFVTWLRRFFEIDETRLRVRLYLREGLDLDAANHFWAELTGIPLTQFGKPYRAVADPTMRRSKHPMGCPKICYSSTTILRTVMGLVHALLSSPDPFRGGEIGITADC